MKKQGKIIVFILVITLIFTWILFINEKSENDLLQKNIDNTFKNAMAISMDGLSKDQSKMNRDDKMHYYYQTVYNLKDSINMFQLTSYKENSNLFLALNRLYIYLQNCRSRNYEIKETVQIYNFLSEIMVYPNDNKVISEFKIFLDNLEKGK